MHKIKTILIADDDKEDQFILQDAFNEIGKGDLLHFEDNGEKVLLFLESCQHPSSLPSLIVLDLNMPRMNGTQTLRNLKSDKRYQRIPVIIYSTSLNDLEHNECLQLGAHAYVIKPLTFDDIIQTARDFCQMTEMS